MDGGVSTCPSSCNRSATNPIGVSDGGVHIAYQLPSQSLQRTTDGSGILVSTTSPFAVTDKLGRVFTNPSLIPIVADRNGNRMTMSANGPGFASGEFAPQLNSGKPANSWTLTDTVGRSWSYAPAANTNGCPSNVGADRAEIWTTPGPSGSARAFEFCFSPVSISTNLPISNGSGVTTQQYVSTTEFLSAIVLPDGTNWQFQYNDSYGDLTKLVLPTGGTITYQYATTTDPYVQETSLGFFSYIRTVTSRAIFDGTNSNTWSYAAAPYSYPNPFVYTVTDPLGNGTVYTGGTISTGTSTAKIQYYTGSASSGTLSKTVNKTYLQSPPGTLRCWLPALPLSTATTWPNGQSSSVTLTYDLGFQFTCQGGSSTQSAYGSVTSTTETDYGGSTLRQTSTQYEWQVNSSYLSANLLSFPYQVGITGSGGTASVSCFFGTAQSCTTYGYDGIGNATSVTQSLNTGPSPVTQYGHNSYGMSTSMTDPKNNTTNYKYDSTGVCVNEIDYPTSGVAQIEHFACDPNTEQITQHTDRNGNPTSYSYDNMLRPFAVNYPDRGQTTVTYVNPNEFYTTENMDSLGNYRRTFVAFDGLGRKNRTAVTNGEAQPYDETVNTCFNSIGLVSLQGYPFQDGGWNSPISCSVAGDSYAYDALGRPTRITHVDGSYGSTSYSGNCATATDEQGKTRQLCYDGLERLTSVTENPGGLNYTTTYAYNALNDLTSVVQGSETRSFVYDSLSRLTSATNPESGTTSYTYDAASNVATRVDARNITTTYSYDALNRLASKTYSDGTQGAYFYYDQTNVNWGFPLTNTTGRLSSIGTWYNNGWQTSSVYSYDPMGRPVIVGQYFSGTGFVAFVPTYSYNLIGGITSYYNGAGVSGAGVTFTQSFNAAGLPTQLTSSWNDSQHPATLASGAHYNGSGSPTAYTLGNGLTETAAYNGLLQPCRMNINSSGGTLASCTAAVPSGSLVDSTTGFNYGAGDNGNLMSWSAGGAQNFNRSYTYDALNRLATMSSVGTTCTGLSWSYDQWGNRTGQTVTGGTCGSSQLTFNSYNHVTNSGFQYDATGNMTHDASHSYTYDAENRVTAVDGGSTATYVYDANGRRVEKTVGGAPKGYLYDIAGNVSAEMQGTSMTADYVFMGGQIMAEYESGTTYFVHQDHLGSTRLLTNVSGGVVDNMDYLPFGEQIAGASITTHKFIGYERDSETGLDNAQARYNSSSLGRFMSPDLANVAGDLDESGNPQSWNAYAYVRNDPLGAVDPNGEDCIYIDSHNAGNSYVQGGDCTSDTDNGIFVNGSVTSFTYNGMTGTYSYSGTNYPGDPASLLSGTITPSPSDPATDLANAVNALNPGGFIMGSARLMAENAAADLGGRLVGLGVEAILAKRAAQAAEVAKAAVDVDNLSNKIVRQMLRRGWTKQEILDTVQNGKAYDVPNKATGGPATEYVNPSTGKFVVVDSATKQVIQVSGPGFLPNHLVQ
jgi:RHS repeat-associated protein